MKIPPVSQMWLESRFTHPVIGAAIHAIATDARSADAIWDNPTEEELAAIKRIAGAWIKGGHYQTQATYQWWGKRLHLSEMVSL